jgi:hypothetical protein
MSIDEIKDRIATAMNIHCDERWWSILDDTTPGHYGVEDLEFQIELADIWVNIPQKTFTFKKGILSFSARLGSSKADDSVDVNVRKRVSGSGTFDFDSAQGIKVLGFTINEEIDLFDDNQPRKRRVHTLAAA